MKSYLPYAIYLTLALILFLSSCTIEKRIYRKGYHIERIHSPNKSNSNSSIEPETSCRQHEQVNSNNQTTQIIIAEEKAASIPDNNSDTTIEKKNIAYVKEALQGFKSPTPIKRIIGQTGGLTRHFKTVRKATLEPYRAKDRETEKTGLWAFLFSILAFFVPLVFSFLLFILAMILGLSSLIKIASHPGSYRGIGFAIFGLVVGIIGFSIFMI